MANYINMYLISELTGGAGTDNSDTAVGTAYAEAVSGDVGSDTTITGGTLLKFDANSSGEPFSVTLNASESAVIGKGYKIFKCALLCERDFTDPQNIKKFKTSGDTVLSFVSASNGSTDKWKFSELPSTDPTSLQDLDDINTWASTLTFAIGGGAITSNASGAKYFLVKVSTDGNEPPHVDEDITIAVTTTIAEDVA